jgi:hypothetical protein
MIVPVNGYCPLLCILSSSVRVAVENENTLVTKPFERLDLSVSMVTLQLRIEFQNLVCPIYD